MFKKLLKKFVDAFKNYAPIEQYGKYPITDPKFALQSLRTYYSEVYAEMIWEEACKEVGVDEDHFTIHQLLDVYAFLSKQNDLVGVVGKSLHIKLNTYIKLSQKTQIQPA